IAARRRAARLAQDPQERLALARSIMRGSDGTPRDGEPAATRSGVGSGPAVDDFLRHKREDLRLEQEREERRWAGR
ncbi:MAG TPA: hypothetical protein VF665_04570, partial [Longimicrobium sp.]|uniref:hypothetical protein n=1 Tax=Longimicrobium sp. TaxID=2029185 RepID=UPI002EDA003C